MKILSEIKQELELLKQHIYYGNLHLATWSLERLESLINELEGEIENLEFLANKAHNLSVVD